MSKTISKIAIIGSGFAGAATAWALARRGCRDIVVLEREAAPGVHASGRNAEILRTVHADPVMAAFSRRGRDLIDELESTAGRPLTTRRGLLLTGEERDISSLQLGPDAQLLGEAGCRAVAPFLVERPMAGALASRDGHVDAGALLSRLVGEASACGVVFRFGREVRGILPVAEGFHLSTSCEEVTANVVVNGAGAWANMVAGSAGCAPLPMTPRRRSLFVGRVGAIGGNEPVVWDVTEGFYARPESPGLVLLSACEEVEQEPCIPDVGEEAEEAVWMKLRTVAPGLADVQPLRSWACLRTVAMDGRMFIGWDPRCRGFLWVGGLGGHGVTTSLAVGELAADLVLGVDNEFASFMAPGRVPGALPRRHVQPPGGKFP